MVAKKKSVKHPSKKLVVSAPGKKRKTPVRRHKDSLSLYEKDFYRWLNTQASLLKEKEFQKLDVENLVEEIESLGRSDKRALRSYLTILILHLLKKKYQPEKATKSWDKSILNSRDDINTILDDSPSLRNELQDLSDKAYESARRKAALETGLDIEKFPKQNPWKLKEII